MLYNTFTIIQYFLRVIFVLILSALVIVERSTALLGTIVGLLVVYSIVSYIVHVLQKEKITIKWIQRKNLTTHQRYYKLFLAGCTVISFILAMYSEGFERNSTNGFLLSLIALVCAFLLAKQLKKEQ